MIAIDTAQILTAEDCAARAEAAQHAQEEQEAQAYLNETDWYVSRFAETGTPIPQEVLDRRAAARSVFY